MNFLETQLVVAGKNYHRNMHEKLLTTPRHTLIPPRGYHTVGVYGSHGPWVDGFGLIIAR